MFIHARKLLDRRAAIPAILAVAAVGFGVSNADATLSAVGPTSQPTGNFPRYFADSSGQRLELCLDQSGNCLAQFPDPGAPPSLPDNFPDESFWFDGEANVPIPGPNGTPGEALLIMATEAAFGTAVADGDQIAFSRIRLRIRGGFPNQDYTFTYPYGSRKIKTDAKGIASFTSDIGCFSFPCDWSQVLRGEVGPWLKWDPAVAPAAPAGYLGNPNVLHKITGSPTGNNLLRVTGGGNTGLPQPSGTSPGGVQTELFAIQGKIDTGPDPAPPGPAAPAASFAPTSLGYSARDIGTTSAAQEVTLTNSGTGAMKISSIAVTGANSGDFAATASTVSPCPIAPATLAAKSSCKVAVTFAPKGLGARNADLAFTDDAAGTPHKVPLSGTGTGTAPPPAGTPGISITPATVAFGDQATGTAVTRQVLVKNPGTADLVIGTTPITGSANFTETATPTSCAGKTIAATATASCTIDVRFLPTGGPSTGTVTINSNAAGTNTIALSGNGVTAPPATAPGIAATPNPLAFGNSTVPVTGFLGIGSRPGVPVSKTLSVTNTGTAPLTITTATIGAATTSSFPADYTITSNGCLNKTIAPGTPTVAATPCGITIRFQAKARGARNAALTVNSNAPTGALKINMSGNGI